jgi:hypothetical protein
VNFKEMTEAAIALDVALHPIATRMVDVNDPNWIESFQRGIHPLDEAGVRESAEALLMLLLDSYSSGNADHRRSIRELFRMASSFAWATQVPDSVESEDGFRNHLLNISAADHVNDPRDIAEMVSDLYARAIHAGIDAEKIILNVAELSSDELNMASFGSTRQLLRETPANHSLQARRP